MSARVLKLPITRFTIRPVNVAVRNIRTTLPCADEKHDSPTAVRVETKPGIPPATRRGAYQSVDQSFKLLAKIHKIEKNHSAFEGATNATLKERLVRLGDFEKRTDSYIKWVVTFGVGMITLGLGGTIFEVYHYDVTQEARMKAYVRETIEGSEKLIMLKIESSCTATQARIDDLSSTTQKSIEHIESKMDRCLRAMERKGWF